VACAPGDLIEVVIDDADTHDLYATVAAA
jgi:hypothetical protein